MIPILGILAVLLCSVKVQAEGVVISELMPVNRTTLADDDGDFSDWIEIHNPTDQPVNLLNHGLSDDGEPVQVALSGARTRAGKTHTRVRVGKRSAIDQAPAKND